MMSDVKAVNNSNSITQEELGTLQALTCVYYQGAMLFQTVTAGDKVSRSSMARQLGLDPRTYGKRPGRQSRSLERKRRGFEDRQLRAAQAAGLAFGWQFEVAELREFFERYTARNGHVGGIVGVALTSYMINGSCEKTIYEYLEGSLAMRIAAECDADSEELLCPLGRYEDALPVAGTDEATQALEQHCHAINSMCRMRGLPAQIPVSATYDVGAIAVIQSIAMAHRWLRLAAAFEVELWRLWHPGVAPVPVWHRLLWKSRSDPKRAPGRVLTWLWLGHAVPWSNARITHASEVTYRDLIPDEEGVARSVFSIPGLNEDPLRWMERHGSGDQPLSPEKLAALITAWTATRQDDRIVPGAAFALYFVGMCAIRLERWLEMLPQVGAADYLRYWEEARIHTESASAPDCSLAQAPRWMQPGRD